MIQTPLSLQSIDTTKGTTIWIRESIENTSDPLMNKSHSTPETRRQMGRSERMHFVNNAMTQQ